MMGSPQLGVAYPKAGRLPRLECDGMQVWNVTF